MTASTSSGDEALGPLESTVKGTVVPPLVDLHSELGSLWLGIHYTKSN